MVAPLTSNPGAGAIAHRYARVRLPLPLGAGYDYRIPDDAAIAPGDFVRVPLGRRHEIGVVWDAIAAPEIDAARVKAIDGVVDLPPLKATMRAFIDWVSAYTMAAPGAVMRLAMTAIDDVAPEAPRLLARVTGAAPAADAKPDRALTTTRARVLEMLRGGPQSVHDLARAARVGTAVVRGMIARGWIELVAAPPPPRPDGHAPGPALSPDQQAAVAAIQAHRGFAVTLIDGVTGSGKTEIYFEAVAAVLRAGRQALVLLPEIAMSTQWFDRFRARFGAPPVVWHSEVPSHERRRAWRRVARGEASVVVGARSALFLPFRDLAVIIVDEEHDPAFKQEDGVIYHARDMAVARARIEGVPIILASATPSMETLANVDQGRYASVHLPDRHAAAMPRVDAVDLRREPPARGRFLSEPLRAALRATVAAGEQALLFLNRRGYAPLTLCRACGHRMRCPDCQTWLVEHRLAGRLACHHCGYVTRKPNACPACGAADSFVACGPGVERVAEEVAGLLPDARALIATSDTIGSPSAAEALIRAIEGHDIDIVIGTQIVAKGHHFPKLTLVGVVDADLGLEGGDLRAAERTWQMLHQVSGRAGRADRPGRVLLQTHNPDHGVMAALVAGDREAFIAAEMNDRRRHRYPPFGRLAALILSATDEAALDETCRALSAASPRAKGLDILGPAPAPIAILRRRHRRRFLVKAEPGLRIQDWIADWLAKVKVPAAVRLAVDIDPQSFL